jgi:magnesium chelatase accessory protein
VKAAPIWDDEGRDWPHRESSRFVDAAGIRWHVQLLGCGPPMLLLHGTGAATHSWQGLAPLLAERYRLIAPDLPGHGFSSAGLRRQMSLPGMAAAVDALLRALDTRPELVLGHSAGAAVGARLCLDEAIAPRALIALNGAFLPFAGLRGRLSSPAAKLLAAVPSVPRWFNLAASSDAVADTLVRITGSRPPAATIRHYETLLRCERHVAAALQMMAEWNLHTLPRELAALRCPLHLLACANDAAVPVEQARQLAARVPQARVEVIPRVGHLGHEENPALVATAVLRIAADPQPVQRPGA